MESARSLRILASQAGSHERDDKPSFAWIFASTAEAATTRSRMIWYCNLDKHSSDTSRGELCHHTAQGGNKLHRQCGRSTAAKVNDMMRVSDPMAA